MSHCIGITMTVQTASTLEHNPTEHKLARGIVAKAMNVETLSYSSRIRSGHCGARYLLSRPAQIGGVGDLTVVFLASHHDHPSTIGFHQRGVVGCIARICVRAAQGVRTKGLGRLHGAQCVAEWCADHGSVDVDLLDRVGNGHARDGGVGATDYRSNHGGEQIGRGERASAVMNAHDRGGGRNPCQTGPNAVAARGTASDRVLATGVGGRHDNDNSITRSCRRRDAPIEHASIAERFVLLGAAEALTGSTGHNDRPHRFRRLGVRWPK